MDFLVISVLVAIIVFIVYTTSLTNNKREQLRVQLESNPEYCSLMKKIESINNDLSKRTTKYIDNNETIKIRTQINEALMLLPKFVVPKNNHVNTLINDLKIQLHKLDETIKEKNKQFVQEEKTKYHVLLSNIDGKALDEEQKNAVVTDEVHNLVIAGAGSGKTLTIAGKVKYLCDIQKVNPNEILLITFTRKAAEEMNHRIKDKLGVPIDAYTFHKLGLEIINKKTNKSFNISNCLRNVIRGYFSVTAKENKKTAQALLQYIAIYQNIETMDSLKKVGEQYIHQKGKSLETLKSKVKEFNNKEKITISGEEVASYEELVIANFLFLNSVEYEYENYTQFHIMTHIKNSIDQTFIYQNMIFILNISVLAKVKDVLSTLK